MASDAGDWSSRDEDIERLWTLQQEEEEDEDDGWDDEDDDWDDEDDDWDDEEEDEDEDEGIGLPRRRLDDDWN